MCIYISAYAWSWGPLGWLYSSEVQPLETRSAGQSITTLVNLMFSFVIGQVRIHDLCKARSVHLRPKQAQAGPGMRAQCCCTTHAAAAPVAAGASAGMLHMMRLHACLSAVRYGLHGLACLR